MRRQLFTVSALLMGLVAFSGTALGQSHQGGRANLILPDLAKVTFLAASTVTICCWLD